MVKNCGVDTGDDCDDNIVDRDGGSGTNDAKYKWWRRRLWLIC